MQILHMALRGVMLTPQGLARIFFYLEKTIKVVTISEAEKEAAGQAWYSVADAWPVLLVLISLVLVLSVALLCMHIYGWSLRKKMEKVVFFDKFTGLPKATVLKTLLQKKKFTGMFSALVYFDIKGLCVFNETYGYLCGDDILLGVARRIQSSGRFVKAFHLQGDSFALLFSKPENRGAIEEYMHELFASLQFLTAGKGMSLHFACGVLMLDESFAKDANILLDNVGFAHGQAKHSAQTKIIFFSEKEKNIHISHRALSGELHKAALQGELVLEFQPKYFLADGALAGAEALVRWQHPERGLMMPVDFVSVFEEDGMIEIMDYYVMQSVLEHINEWQKIGLEPPAISVNLSGANMSNVRLAENLIALVNGYEIGNKKIELELTESALPATPEELVQTMQKLREGGFLLSMDDFGTGFSSLNLLRMLPLDTVKLDKCFLDGIQEDIRLQHFLKDVIKMAKNMGMLTLIEGVESNWEACFARDAGCDLVQGFWFSSPLSPKEFTNLLHLDKRQQ
ncbi:MAG: EAL domain-containing protein [Oscillospiraceae bacterium]